MLYFIKKRDLEKVENGSIITKIKDIFKIYVCTFIVYIFFTIFLISTLALLNLHTPSNNVDAYLNTKTTLQTIILTVFIAPIAEEIGYRLSLLYSKRNISITIFFLSFFLYCKITSSFNYEIDEHFKYKIIFSLILALLSFILLLKRKDINNRLIFFWSNNHMAILLTSIFLFTFSHIFNFNISNKTLILMPIITFPQLIYAISLSYTRLKYGIFYSIILHSMINITSLVPTFLDYIK